MGYYTRWEELSVGTGAVAMHTRESLKQENRTTFGSGRREQYKGRMSF